ncbi:MAG: ornithine--oxo-acid transaminase [Candidatus Eisenbacteria bacterium]|uniref:ornithine aminotransferase n=1 Tax=Eiseniibacteriota bacterium TaxID=2212470 RepID=A0A933SCY3_UNCEI|nr:ornithine--oxo-acid transaminase [Candidatus Eisenbacteria bacterium]
MPAVDPHTPTQTARHIESTERHSAHNYAPLPVVVSRASGAWVEDVDGHRYLDMLSAYSALNFGHGHPEIVDTFVEQAKRLSLTSRAFHNDQFAPFCETITRFCGMDRVLPMNTGAEAVETAIKTARKWGYKVKGVADGKAEIIVCDGNFHGRTVTIVSFSDDDQYRDGFGPFTPGFKLVPYGDLAAFEAAITPNTVGFLVEPIQGEGGIVVPPEGYLKGCRDLCTKHRVLFMADEIQTGLGRTGRKFACDHEGVKPDVLILGKALGGGMMPVSAVLASDEVMGVFRPGDHGSTFGGNPLACAVASKALEILERDRLPERAARFGERFMDKLRGLTGGYVREVRGRGLLIGIALTPEAGPAKAWCKQLLHEGMLCKDTVESVMRIAPPLVIEEMDLDWAFERIARTLRGKRP